MMAPITAKVVTALSCILLLSDQGLAHHYSYAKHAARQAPTPCVPDSLLGRVGPGNGGRKIGIVIDASGSMATNDPNDLRLEAAKALSDTLISSSEASNGKEADLLCVSEFSSSADLVYSLGDPAGAAGPITGITLGSGTAIGTGIQAALDELTKPGNDPTANRTGLVVFTDGQDSTTTDANFTMEQTKRAVGLGVRVSFGFLSLDSSYQDTEILRAILNSGGIYATIDSASAQQPFIALVLAHGLTGIDASGANGSSTLLPGIATAAYFSQTSPNVFTYPAKAGEKFNVTVTAIDPVQLKVTLRDPTTDTDIKSNTTDAKSYEAFMEYTPSSGMDVQIAITATDSNAAGIYSIGVRSATALSGNCTINTNSTQPNATVTTAPTVQYTGGAAPALGYPTGLLSALFLGLGYLVAGVAL